ncbi:spermidine/putrescine ABC transporter permease [Psittacicella hinzii]|uniref:Spermidine/putrescine ABC transporter permease n=1 Tax=Psittacicella hinzii TaxID=2028575 RepID=A0A3A1Y8F8_9GAMM|nr:ABC transporter permease subunit [Psittacicella hinzii]RIY32404.1 spermidine/putrescine ABC transporter permease [Psittacicella hinzii]
MKSLINLLSIKNFTVFFILFWLGLFILIPGILVVLVSFFSSSPNEFYEAVFSLESYSKLTDPLYLKVFQNSLYLALCTTLVTFIIGYLYALAVVNCRKKWHALLLILVILPFWTNSLVRIYGIKNLLGANGFINQFLKSIGLIDKPLQILYTDTAVIIGMVSILLPYMILPIYSSLQKIDSRLIEAAKDLGAGPFKRFTKVTFPLSFSGVIAGITLVFLPSMGLFYISDLLGGPKSLLIGSVIRQEFLFTRNWPLGAALSIGMIAILMFTMWLVNKFKIGRVE